MIPDNLSIIVVKLDEIAARLAKVEALLDKSDEHMRTKNPNEPPLRTQIEAAFEAALHERIEDGYPSIFGKTITRLYRDYGGLVTVFLYDYLDVPRYSFVMAECLNELGQIDNPASYQSRKVMLTNALVSSKSSLAVRDGAVRGLSHFDDPETIDAVKYALSSNTHQNFKKNLKYLLDQLEAHNDQ